MSAIEAMKQIHARLGTVMREIESDLESKRRRLDAAGAVLAAHGCDCECGHHRDMHGVACERCLSCRIAAALR